MVNKYPTARRMAGNQRNRHAASWDAQQRQRNIQKPSNDNIRPRLPSNDNIRASVLARALFRGAPHPFIRGLALAYDIYKAFEPEYTAGEEGLQVPAGWELYKTCDPSAHVPSLYRRYSSSCLYDYITSPENFDNMREGPTRSGDYWWQSFAKSEPWPVNPALVLVNSGNVYRLYDPANNPPSNAPAFVNSPSMPVVYPPASPLTSVDPSLQPLLQPSAPPEPLPFKALPYRRTSNFSDPRYGTVRGYALSEPVQENVIPTISKQEITTSSRPTAAEASGHVRRPPIKGEKESKVSVRGMAPTAMLILDTVNDVMDLINMLYRQIPRKHQINGKTTIQQRLALVYKHHQKIDMPRAIADYMLMELEDQSIGEMGKKFSNATQEMYKYTGSQNPIGLQGMLPATRGVAKPLTAKDKARHAREHAVRRRQAWENAIAKVPPHRRFYQPDFTTHME